jgi:hypothetical protein
VIRAVANKKLYLNNFEYNYLLEIYNAFGDDCFRGIFETDDDGRLISIEPSLESSTPLAIIFFLLNVMMNQRLEAVDVLIDRVTSIENKILKMEL